jgi:glycosyltransferase involved in cell wall biosynthesis
LIDIVIPFYNSENTLSDTIWSVLLQGGFANNIVAVDDGSVDHSACIARTFLPEVQVLCQSNQGASAARNRGIAETSGEWIVFLDADDLLLPGTLRRRLDTAHETGADVVICDWEEFSDDQYDTSLVEVKSPNMAAMVNDAETSCATHFKPAVNALMYRRSLVQKIGGFREDLPIVEDARLLFDAAYYGATFAHSPHLGARVRKRPCSLSRRDPVLFWRCCLLNGTQIEALWRARGSLSSKQWEALADIYNGAAHALFRAGDPSFREALAALRAGGLPIGLRNRIAEIVADAAGQDSAVRLAELWTRGRRVISGTGRGTPTRPERRR